MAERIPQGTLVEIQRLILSAGERAPQVPEETQQVPLVMRVKGFLTAPAELGGEVEICTPAGRRLHGVLIDAAPAYTHTFGPILAELAPIGNEVRALLRTQGHIR